MFLVADDGVDLLVDLVLVLLDQQSQGVVSASQDLLDQLTDDFRLLGAGFQLVAPFMQPFLWTEVKSVQESYTQTYKHYYGYIVLTP